MNYMHTWYGEFLTIKNSEAKWLGDLPEFTGNFAGIDYKARFRAEDDTILVDFYEYKIVNEDIILHLSYYYGPSWEDKHDVMSILYDNVNIPGDAKYQKEYDHFEKLYEKLAFRMYAAEEDFRKAYDTYKIKQLEERHRAFLFAVERGDPANKNSLFFGDDKLMSDIVWFLHNFFEKWEK